MSDSTADTSQPIDPREAARLDPGHGNTVAGWTTVFTMLVGFIVLAVAFFLNSQFVLLAGIGVVIILIGLIAGLILKLAGFGVGGHRTRQH
ncbi:HGxxPAAW family protein [Spelaeicoccus albus]|uniref:Energy-coupling factor transporter transmembrane protein EcfT n=1 Tax=Spelaeicoccus albus TaxID=1280376 RepID=A0A7Z0IIJ7_9MICO|nr:HGxxPAAW family protein [Spelaeicoccus albus]NYI68583.1 energy-coupling factor transporter transmembrane protein EcfT [Spelaeicoccus albus]